MYYISYFRNIKYHDCAKKPLYASKLREDAKVTKYFQAYKNMDDIHFEPFVVESGARRTWGKSSRNI